VNDSKYIGLDVHQATISAAALDSVPSITVTLGPPPHEGRPDECSTFTAICGREKSQGPAQAIRWFVIPEFSSSDHPAISVVSYDVISNQEFVPGRL